MRLALVVAPSDPLAGSAAARREALGWLRGQLSRHGFHVVIVGGGREPWADVERALLGVSMGDAVLVHASGRLAGPDALAFVDEWSLPLRTLTDWLVARGASDVSFVLEVLHDGAADDSLRAAECLGAAVRALAAKEHGYSVLAATRPLVHTADRIAFTRLALPQPEDLEGLEPSTEALLCAMYERAGSVPEGYAIAQSFTFVRGSAARSVSPPAPAPAPAPPGHTADSRREEVLARMARLDELETPSRKARELVALARILQVELGDADGALEALEYARSFEPGRAGVLEALRRGYERTGRWDRAFELHVSQGRTDEAFLAALALEELGVAGAEQQAVLDEHRTVGPVRARGALDAAAWDLLRAPGSDGVVSALFAAVERAAIAARADELRSRRELVALDESGRLDDGGTISIVRTFHWAARVLEVECPALYARDDVPGGVALVPGRAPSTALGPSVLSGLSAKDLAFLAGRHLTSYRPEYHVLAYFPTQEDLTTLLFAAVEVVMSGATPAGASGAVPALRARISKHLGAEERVALEAAVTALDARGGRVSLSAWIRSAELTAARVGLLLCGDLRTAAALARPAPRESLTGAPIDELRSDLVAFCASRAHATLRARFVAPGAEPAHGAAPRTALEAAQ